MAKITIGTVPITAEVSVKVELYRDEEDGVTTVYLLVTSLAQQAGVMLSADQADELAAEIKSVAEQLHALEVLQP